MTSQPSGEGNPPPPATLPALARFFLRLGCTAFGGPAVHIALMQQELVTRRRWLSREEFLDSLGLVNLIPGPSSTELAIQLGFRLCGWPGLLAAGLCFILPAAAITLALAALYVHFGALPQMAAILAAVKPVMIAILLQALWTLRATILTRPLPWLWTALAALATACGVPALYALLGTGALALALHLARTRSSTQLGAMLFALPAPSTVPAGLAPLFLFFLKLGAVLFGSGYVLLAFLRTDLVTRLHWLTDPQLLDAVTIGQLTPGPVFTTATFIGYLLGGLPGAALATTAIFLPSFFYIAALGPLLPRLRASAAFVAFLGGVNAAALGLIAAVTVQLGRAALTGALPLAIAAASALALFRFRANSALLILAAAALGLLLSH